VTIGDVHDESQQARQPSSAPCENKKGAFYFFKKVECLLFVSQAAPARFTIKIVDGSESDRTEANETIAFDEGTHLDERVDERLKGLSD